MLDTPAVIFDDDAESAVFRGFFEEENYLAGRPGVLYHVAMIVTGKDQIFRFFEQLKRELERSILALAGRQGMNLVVFPLDAVRPLIHGLEGRPSALMPRWGLVQEVTFSRQDPQRSIFPAIEVLA
jgi:hypothetical protein